MASRCPTFDLIAIEAALRRLQAGFASINPHLQDRRDPLADVVLENLLAGYAFVDRLVATNVDLFAMGNLSLLLELNAIVLCGTGPDARSQHVDHLAATERRFYDEDTAGIRDVVEWYERHRSDTVWKLAAGVFIRILSEPQLFLEGNHRTGSLVVSYLLGRAGEPPLVLTPENARAFFDPATLVKRTHKHSLVAHVRIPGLRKKLARFFQAQVNSAYLALPPTAPVDRRISA